MRGWKRGRGETSFPGSRISRELRKWRTRFHSLIDVWILELMGRPRITRSTLCFMETRNGNHSW